MRTLYPGTPEPMEFSEPSDINRAGVVVVVEIEKPFGEPKIAKHRVNRLNWLQIERSLGAAIEWSQLQVELEKEISTPYSTLLQLQLKGTAEPQVVEEIQCWAERAKERFFYLEVNTDQLHPQVDMEKLLGMVSIGGVSHQVTKALHSLQKLLTQQELREEEQQLLEELRPLLGEELWQTPVVEEAFQKIFHLLRESRP